MKITGANYVNGKKNMKITKKKNGSLNMTRNLWSSDVEGYWNFNEFKGKYGMVTACKKSNGTFTDWFEVIGFDDPTAEKPKTVTIKNAKTGKTLKLKRK